MEKEDDSTVPRKRPRVGEGQNGARSVVTTTTSQQSTRLPYLGNIFGIPVRSDSLLHICEFLRQYCAHSHVEIEAKLGVLLDNRTGSRVYLPVRCETLLDRNAPYRFKADVGKDIFDLFNKRLNARFSNTQQLLPQEGKITYKHTNEIDTIYEDRTRVTIQKDTGQIIRCLRKERLGDLNFLCPNNSRIDFRISASKELPVDQPPKTARVKQKREKNRISYAYGIFSLDLTCVENVTNGRREVLFEMEVEISDMEFVRTQLTLEQQGQRNYLINVAQALLDNVRTLTLLAREFDRTH